MTLLEEILAKCPAEVRAGRDLGAIVAVMNVGRVRMLPVCHISERGVRAAMHFTKSSPFLRLLKTSSEAVGIPTWLGDTMVAMGIPEGMHEDLSDAMKSAWHWLLDTNGIDIASPTVAGMLDIIAASDSAKYGEAVSIIKALTTIPDHITEADVQAACRTDTGDWLI